MGGLLCYDGGMSQRNILIAEDDEAIRTVLADALNAHDYLVLEAADGRAAFEILLTEVVDLVLLDINMPEIDGFQLLSLMAKECPGVPSIVLSARGEEPDRVKGLVRGADDYITKPFSIAELLARITAVLRRYPRRESSAGAELVFPGGRLDSAQRQVVREDGTTCKLTEKEADLLRYFLLHQRRVISQEELLRRLWASAARANETRAVAVTLTRLKEKLPPEAATYIKNIRGRGYIWQHPDEPVIL